MLILMKQTQILSNTFVSELSPNLASSDPTTQTNLAKLNSNNILHSHRQNFTKVLLINHAVSYKHVHCDHTTRSYMVIIRFAIIMKESIRQGEISHIKLKNNVPLLIRRN